MAKALRDGLEADGYSVRVAHTGEEGFYLINAQPFDLAILDVMLPDHDGFEILSTLRRRGIKTPVLLLTCRVREPVADVFVTSKICIANSSPALADTSCETVTVDPAAPV